MTNYSDYFLMCSIKILFKRKGILSTSSKSVMVKS